MTKPISPAEAIKQAIANIPDQVIETWNKMIVSKLVQGTAVIHQDDIAKAIAKEMKCDEKKVFEQKWLDIEPLYEKQGWNVSYDKPAYNETYEAYFTFKMKRVNR